MNPAFFDESHYATQRRSQLAEPNLGDYSTNLHGRSSVVSSLSLDVVHDVAHVGLRIPSSDSLSESTAEIPNQQHFIEKTTRV